MPIIEDLNLFSKTRLVVWEINEDLKDLRSEVLLDKYSAKLLADRKSKIHKAKRIDLRFGMWVWSQWEILARKRI